MKEKTYKEFVGEEDKTRELRRKVLRPGSVKPIHVDNRATFKTSWDKISGKPPTFPPSPHNHDDRYYQKSDIDDKLEAQDELSELLDVEIENPSDGDVLTWDAELAKWIAKTGGVGGVSTFLDLTDTPADYSGQGGKVVKVKDTEDGLEFGTGGGGASTFKDLTDTPSGYSGKSKKYVRINANEDALEFGARITISSSAPSGGNDGDIWLKY